MTRFSVFTASFLTLIVISGTDKSVKNKRKPVEQPSTIISAQPKNVYTVGSAKDEMAAMVVTNTGDTVYYKQIFSKRKLQMP